ncbi:ABC transporter ATP-binding protein, partial [Mesorhizobium sp. M7A.F.Ca.CA.002.05.1.1]
MISIKLDNVSLAYRLYEKLTLTAPDRRLGGLGGKIGRSGGKQVVQALEDVSFELKAGDRLGLVGPNGAGKTTLLKVLYGIYQPSSGIVAIEGKVDALFNINIGFRPEATGRRNIVLRGLISGWTEAEIQEKMPEIIAFSELGDFIDVPFKTYSQGMA